MEKKEVKACMSSDTVKGMGFLFLMLACWELSALTIKKVFGSDENEVPFKNPLFITYYSSCLFMAYLIPALYEWIVLSR